MRIVNIYEGELGDPGQNGLGGVDASEAGYTVLSNPVLDLFRQNKPQPIGDLTSSRASSASIVDRYGNVVYLPPSSIDNLLPYSEDFSQWFDVLNSWTLTATGVSDPLGGNNASTITIDQDTGDRMIGLAYTLPQTGTYTASFWIRNNTAPIRS